MDGQNDGRTGCWLKSKSFAEVAEDRDVFADGWSGVGASVGFGVEALTVEEVVFDELVVRVEAQDLVVDVARVCVRADDEAGDA